MNDYWTAFDERLARLIALRDEFAAELTVLEGIPDASEAFYWNMTQAYGAIEAAVDCLQSARQRDNAEAQ